MGEKLNEAVAAVEQSIPLPAVMPAGGLPDHIRCSVCERPLLRASRDRVGCAIMVKCRHCGALQHRRL
jgi:hypothetical protein